MAKKYIVRLTNEEREQLEDLANKGKRSAYIIKHAQILLAVDAEGPNLIDREIAKILRCHMNTVKNIRQRFVEQGLEAALQRKKQENPPRKRILDGEKEAQLLAIACSQAPDGHSRWTLKLLGERLVTLEIVDSISDQTVRRALKKMNLSHICKNTG